MCRPTTNLVPVCIASADRVMERWGTPSTGSGTRTSWRRSPTRCCAGWAPERDAQLGRVAGYLHDMGNALARDAHGQSGAVLVYQTLHGRVQGADLMPVLAAIANHEETEGWPSRRSPLP